MLLTQVDYSETESDMLGLKVGRCNVDGTFDENELRNQIIAGCYDVCRLKFPAEDEMASSRLHKIGLPFFFSGSIRRYKTPTEKMLQEEPLHPDMEFIPYDGTQNDLLRTMLADTWGTYPIGYYRAPYLEHLVSKEQEIESVFRFYKKQNDPRENPNNGFMFLRHDGKYVGFFAINRVGENLESHVGGILSPYRKEGYFLDKLAYIKRYCKENGLKNFVFGARNENAEVQRIFQFVGFQPLGTENVFHVISMLHTSQREPVVIKLSKAIDTSSDAYAELSRECMDLSKKILNIPDGQITFSLNFPQSPIPENAEVTYTFPVISKDEILIVLSFGSFGIGYFNWKR